MDILVCFKKKKDLKTVIILHLLFKYRTMERRLEQGYGHRFTLRSVISNRFFVNSVPITK